MSLKPLCLTPEQLNSFTYKEFKSKFFKAVKKLAKKHDKQDVAAPFYLCTTQKFADAESEFFMVFGKLSKWKKYAKEQAMKTLALRGMCYVTLDTEKKCLMLNLMPVAGKLKTKENLITKALKTVIAQSRCQIQILKGEFTEAMMEKLATATEAMEDVADDDEADAMENTVSKMAAKIEAAKKAGLTPDELKLVEAMAADIEKLENLLEELAAADDAEEIIALDKKIKTIFAKYVSKKQG